jgi:hypothetical protein
MKKDMVWGLYIPNYRTDQKLSSCDWLRIAEEVVDALLKILETNRIDIHDSILIRALGAGSHYKTVDEIINIILETGTDKYNSELISDFDKKIVSSPKPEIFADLLDTRDKDDLILLVEQLIENLSSQSDRKNKVRVDIITIYRSNELRQIDYAKDRNDGYRFKHPGKAKDAVIGVIKIL